MENNKDIGKAFREKLDGLQKQPGNAVWDAIKKDLPKNKPGLLPLFWTEASNTIKAIVLSLLLALIVVSGYYSIESNEHNEGGSATKSTPNGNSTNAGGNTLNTDNLLNNGNKVQNESGILENGVNNINNNTSGSANGGQPKEISGKDVKGTTITDVNKTESDYNTNGKSASNGNYSKSGKSAKGNRFATSVKNNDSETTRVGENRASNLNSKKNSTASTVNAKVNNESELTNQTSNSKNNKKSNKPVSAAGNTTGEPIVSTKDLDAKRDSGNDADNKASGFNAKGSNSNTIAINDTTPKTGLTVRDSTIQTSDSIHNTILTESLVTCKDTVETNTLKGNEVTGATFRRFYIYAHAAATGFKLKNDVIQDSTLTGKATATKVDYNYGAYIGYNFNEKWSVRTGITLTGLQHTIKDVVLQNTYAVVPGSDSSPNGYVHVFAPKNYAAITYTRNGSNAAVVQNLGNTEGQAVVNIIQKVAFAEVPVELTYKLFGNTFGAGITGGISTIFTTKNIVYAQNSQGTMWLGSNKSIRDIGFSTTLGLHFYYRPVPYLQINAEPVFKYYINSFSNSKPYSFGIQAGLQFNFDLFRSKK